MVLPVAAEARATMSRDFSATEFQGFEANPQTLSSTLPEGERCDICGFPMLDVHCKLICRNCGFMRDCSDP
jgi:hypothetical protein